MAATSSNTESAHQVSVNVYGRGDLSKPSHVGIALYTPRNSTCRMHHIRCPDDENFIYDPRSFPLAGPVLWGRSVLAEVPELELQRAEAVLTAFGANHKNIPEMGIGNCHNWMAGGVAELERHGVLQSGEGDFWKSQINRSGDEIAESCRQTGRVWVEGEKQVVDPSDIDARFADVEVRKVGKLADNPAFSGLLHRDLASTVSDKAFEPSMYFSKMNFSKTK